MNWGIFRISRAKVTCFFLLAFSFLLMTFRLTKTVQSFRAFLFYWISPTQEMAASSVKFASGLGFNLASLVRTHHENVVLKEKMKLLSLLETQYQEVLSENQRLRQLLSLKSSLAFDMIFARVSGRDAHTWTQSLWIDRGSKEGVNPNSPVLSVAHGFLKDSPAKSGVIGRIWESGSHSSSVLLISDPLSSVAVLLPRTREQGLVQGQGSFLTIVEYLDPLADIQVGDKVVTSGLGGVFPSGLRVGTLVEIMTSPLGFKRAKLKPSVSLNTVKEVVVLKAKSGKAVSTE